MRVYASGVHSVTFRVTARVKAVASGIWCFGSQRMIGSWELLHFHLGE